MVHLIRINSFRVTAGRPLFCYEDCGATPPEGVVLFCYEDCGATPCIFEKPQLRSILFCYEDCGATPCARLNFDAHYK